MSKYLAYPDMVFRDRQLLLEALSELGFSSVDEGNELPLFGYAGDRRPETAALVIRRHYIGSASNDLGFARTSEGYFPLISDYDSRTLLAGRFLSRLRVAYAERVVESVRKRLRGTVHRSTEGSIVKLRVRY
jgi:Protein of unknown function (DUF1257)